MNSVTSSSTSSSVSFTAAVLRDRSGWFVRSAVVLALLMGLATLWLHLVSRPGYTGDEGFYGVTARNMVERADYWLRPSYFPLGNFETDREGFAHPTINSYVYAVSLWGSGGSLAGPEVANLVLFGALLFFAFRLLARADRVAAAAAVLLLAASPALRGYFWMLEAEPLMTLAGVVALYCAMRTQFAPLTKRHVFGAGLAVGVAFVTKLWLFGPIGLAVGAALVIRAWEQRAAWASVAAGVGLFVLGVVAPAAVHLGTVAILYPQDVSFWLRNIYFGVITNAGISGAKMGGAGPANWVHPVWYYGAALYRDHFFLLPPMVFGAWSAWTAGGRVRQLALVLAIGAAGVVPLSLIKVKEPLYVLAPAVFLYLLAGVCLGAMARRLRTRRPLERGPTLAGYAACGGAALAVVAAYAGGIKREDITLAFAAGHTLVMLAAIAAMAWANGSRSGRRLERSVLTIATVAGVASLVVGFREWHPRDAEIGRLIEPAIAAVPKQEVAFIASNFKSYQFYTFAKGRYWHDVAPDLSPEALANDPTLGAVRAFILSPEDAAKPENARWLAWLEATAAEKTAELDARLGRVSGWRVFVRGPEGM